METPRVLVGGAAAEAQARGHEGGRELASLHGRDPPDRVA
jgi:hypothetical protein